MRTNIQANLTKTRSLVIKSLTNATGHRPKHEAVDLTVSIIGLYPNLDTLKPHLRRNPVEIAEFYQETLGVPLLQEGNPRIALSQEALQWKCNTADIPAYKGRKFEASFEVLIDHNPPPGSYVITMDASRNEAARLEPYSRKLFLRYLDAEICLGSRAYNNPLGFAGVLPTALSSASTPDVLIVKNIQTSLFCKSVGFSNILRAYYKYWDKVFLLAIEDLADFMGIPSVWMTTANYQLRKWRYDKLLTIHPMTAVNVYAHTPQSLGYTLREINPLVIEGVTCDLVWEKGFRPAA